MSSPVAPARSRAFPVLLGLALIAVPARGNGLVTTEEAKLLPPVQGGLDLFGHGLAVEGDTAAVGLIGYGPGAVHVFTRSGTTWTWTAELVGSQAPNGAWLGQAVDMEGDTIVAVADDGGSFQLYVFELVGASWVETALLEPSDGPLSASLSQLAVDLAGSRIAVGVPGADAGAVGGAGAAYVYERNGTDWSTAQEFRIDDATPAAWDDFGIAVALDGTRLAVGSPGADLQGAWSAGDVQVFERDASGWSPAATLTSPDVEAWDQFGRAVAFEAGVLAVGVPGEDAIGCVDVYVDGGGAALALQDQLFATVPKGGSSFGESLDLDGGRIGVGAPTEGPGGGQRGAAYFFSVNPNGTWVQRKRVVPAEATGQMMFGYDVGFSGDTLIASGPWFSSAVSEGGGAWVFRFEPPVPLAYCTAKPYASGCLPAVGWNGRASMTGPDTFAVVCRDVPKGKTGLFFWGTTGPASLPFLGGTLCVQPGLTRTLPQASAGQDPCDAGYVFPFTQAYMLAQGLWNGTTVHGQWWLRDPSNPDGTGVALSDGVEFEIGP